MSGTWRSMSTRRQILGWMLLLSVLSAMTLVGLIRDLISPLTPWRAVSFGLSAVAVVASFQAWWNLLGRLASLDILKRAEVIDLESAEVAQCYDRCRRTFLHLTADMSEHLGASSLPPALAVEFQTRLRDADEQGRQYQYRVRKLDQRRIWLRRQLRAAIILSHSPWQLAAQLLRRPRTRTAGRALTWIALILAGPRHAHLREAWHADLAGAPEEGLSVDSRRAFRLALGFILAGLRLRVRTLSMPVWIPIDWMLSRKSRTRNAIALVVASVAVYIDITGGLNQLLTSGVESCSIIATTLGTLAHWLRRLRGIELSSPATDDAP